MPSNFSFICFSFHPDLDDILIGEGLVGLVILGVLEQDFVHVR